MAMLERFIAQWFNAHLDAPYLFNGEQDGISWRFSGKQARQRCPHGDRARGDGVERDGRDDDAFLVVVAP